MYSCSLNLGIALFNDPVFYNKVVNHSLFMYMKIEVAGCSSTCISLEKNKRFPFLDILGYLKNTHNNPKFGRVR